MRGGNKSGQGRRKDEEGTFMNLGKRRRRLKGLVNFKNFWIKKGVSPIDARIILNKKRCAAR